MRVSKPHHAQTDEDGATKGRRAITTFVLFYRTPIIYIYHLWGGALLLPFSFPFVMSINIL